MSECNSNIEDGALKELLTVVNDTNLATRILRGNNGYSLKLDKNGQPSKLFNDLVRFTGSKKQALKIKLAMYSELNLSDEPSIYDLTQMLFDKMVDSEEKKKSKKNYVLLQDELHVKNIGSLKEIKSAIINHTLDRVASHFKNSKVVLQIHRQTGMITVIDNNSTSRARKRNMVTAFINGIFNNAIARYDYKTSSIVLSINDNMVENFQRKLLHEATEKELQKAKEHEEYTEKEGNYFVKDGEIIPIYDRLPSEGKQSDNVFLSTKSNIRTLLTYQKNNINSSINALRLKARTSKDYSKYITRISQLIRIKDKLTKQIQNLTNLESGITPQMLGAIIENNFSYAQELVKTGHPDDLYKAIQIYNSYSIIANFKDDENNYNPLISTEFMKILDNPNIEERIMELKIEENNIENGDSRKSDLQSQIKYLENIQALRSLLIGKAADAESEHHKLIDKVRKLAIDVINEAPGTEKLYGRKLTVNDILESKKDLDWLSREILGIGRTYDFGGEESTLATAIYKIATDAMTEKNAEFVKFTRDFDGIENNIRKELKKNNTSYREVFLKKNEFGTYKFQLIDKFNSSWYSLFNRHKKEMNIKIKKANGQHSKIQAAYAERFRKLNLRTIYHATDKTNVLIDPVSLPEVVEQFKDDPVLSKDIALNGFSKITESTKQKLIEKYGKIKYDEIVEKQIDKLKEYTEKVKDVVKQAAIDFEIEEFDFKTRAEFETLLTRINSEDINNMIKYDNPMNAIQGINNQHPGYYDNEGVSLKYNIVVPFSDDFIESRFSQIDGNQHYSEFYKVAKDAIQYINDVLGDTNLKLSGMSTMMISTNIFKMLMRKDIPFLYKIKDFLRMEKDYFVQFLQGGRTVKHITDIQTEISKAGFNSPDRRISNQYEDISKYFKSIGVTRKGIQKLGNYDDRIISTLTKIADIPNGASYLARYLGIKQDTVVRLDRLIVGTLEKTIEDQGNFDLGKILKLYTKLATAYDGRKDIITTVDILRNVYKDIPKDTSKESMISKIKHIAGKVSKEDKSKQRVNANAKMDSYFNRVIRNYHGVKPIRLTMIKKLYTSKEKEKIKRLKARLKVVEKTLKSPELTTKAEYTLKKERNDINRQIENTGQHIDLSAPINIVSAYIVIKALIYNPKTMINNFAMGQFTNAVLDHMGLHWTPGNYVYVTNFLRRRMLNTKNRVLKGLSKHHMQKYNSVRIAEILVTRSLILDDVRNELQKADKYVGKETLSAKLHPYYMSITGVEWYNQVGPTLCVLMDIKVKDSFGNEHPGFTKDGHFTMYDENIEGLKLKPEFKYKYDENGNPTTELSEEGKKNVENWEDLKGSQFKDFRLRAKNAIRDGQGDFSQGSGMEIKDSALGRLAATLHTWLGQYIWLTFGKEESIITGKKKRSLISHFTPASLTAVTAAMMSIAFGPETSLIAAGSVYAIAKPLLKNIDRELINYASDIRELAGFMGTVVESMGALLVNYTTGKKIIPVNSEKLMGFKPKYDDTSTEEGKEALRALEEHRQAINSLSVMIGASLTMVLMAMGMHKMFNCPDYEKDSIRCKKIKNIENMVDNIMMGIYSDMTMGLNPYSLYQLTKLKIFDSWIGKLLSISQALDDWFGDNDISTSGETSGQSKLQNRLYQLAPAPTSFGSDIQKILYPRTGSIKQYTTYAATTQLSTVQKLQKVNKEVRALAKRKLMKKYRMYDNIPKVEYDRKMKLINKMLNNKYPTYSKIYKKALERHSQHEWETKTAGVVLKNSLETLKQLKK